MADIIITEATIGGAKIAVRNNRDRDNMASTLLVSYVPDGHKTGWTTEYAQTLTLGGTPLSLALCSLIIS